MIETAIPAEAVLVPLDCDAAEFRRQVIFQCCKWDPQVGDVNTISDHAVVLGEADAAHLRFTAEALAAETLALEQALMRRPDLYAELGIPRRLRPLLTQKQNADHVRVMRFDFHPTDTGWAVSEVNSDVPGGFGEASTLPVLAAAHTQGTPAGDVAGALVAAISRRIDAGARIGFVHASSYSDDRQVMQYLANRFSGAGFSRLLLAPDHVRWEAGKAHSIVQGREGPLAALVRFYPADWLRLLPQSSGWRGYFSSATVMANPPLAALSQSKRLPLLWDKLGVATPAWRAALPETRALRDAPWRTDDSWLIKPALGRVGEDVAWRGSSPEKDWRKLARAAALSPRDFIAQRRFIPRLLASRDGQKNLCVGVFTVDGKAAGFYGRLSSGAVIDKHAQDVAVLIRAKSAAKAGWEHRHVA